MHEANPTKTKKDTKVSSSEHIAIVLYNGNAPAVCVCTTISKILAKRLVMPEIINFHRPLTGKANGNVVLCVTPSFLNLISKLFWCP